MFTNDEGRRWDAERYAGWWREGGPPPPISALESDDGKVLILDGHRRWFAARLAGVRVPAWVGPAAETGLREPGGRPICTWLTRELAVLDALAAGQPVPPEVILDVLDGIRLPRMESLVRKHRALVLPTGVALAEAVLPRRRERNPLA